MGWGWGHKPHIFIIFMERLYNGKSMEVSYQLSLAFTEPETLQSSVFSMKEVP